MISAKVTVDDDILDAIREAAQKAPQRFSKLYNQRLQPLRKRILARLTTEPGPPNYPLRWKSQRQRRYVMAKLRREGNLPYQRSHDLVRAWRVTFTPYRDGGVFEVYNERPEARFVQGDDAQPFHVDRWPQAAPVIAEARVEAESILIDVWYEVSVPRG